MTCRLCSKPLPSVGAGPLFLSKNKVEHLISHEERMTIARTSTRGWVMVRCTMHVGRVKEKKLPLFSCHTLNVVESLKQCCWVTKAMLLSHSSPQSMVVIEKEGALCNYNTVAGRIEGHKRSTPLNISRSIQNRCDFWPPKLTSMWRGCYGLCFWHRPTELAHSFDYDLVSICVFMALSNSISFHKYSWQLSTFWLVFRSSFCLIGPFNYISVCESLLQP